MKQLRPILVAFLFLVASFPLHARNNKSEHRDSITIERVSFGNTTEPSNCTSSSCTIYRQTPSLWAGSSISRTATGTYSITFNGTPFADFPSCTCSATDETSGAPLTCGVPSVSLSSLTVKTLSTSSAADAEVELSCTGYHGVPVPTGWLVTSGLVLDFDANYVAGGLPATSCNESPSFTWSDVSTTGLSAAVNGYGSCTATGFSTCSPYYFDFGTAAPTSQYIVTTGTAPSLSSLTVQAWIDATTLGSGSSYFYPFSFGVSGTSRAYGLWVGGTTSTDDIGFSIGSDTALTSSAAFPATTGQWHNVAVTYNSGTSTPAMYLDATSEPLNTSSFGTPGALPSYTNFEIGRTSESGVGTSAWPGKVAQVLVYNRALTQPEILANCNAGVARFSGASCPGGICWIHP